MSSAPYSTTDHRTSASKRRRVDSVAEMQSLEGQESQLTSLHSGLEPTRSAQPSAIRPCLGLRYGGQLSYADEFGQDRDPIHARSQNAQSARPITPPLDRPERVVSAEMMAFDTAQSWDQPVPRAPDCISRTSQAQSSAYPDGLLHSGPLHLLSSIDSLDQHSSHQGGGLWGASSKGYPIISTISTAFEDPIYGHTTISQGPTVSSERTMLHGPIRSILDDSFSDQDAERAAHADPETTLGLNIVSPSSLHCLSLDFNPQSPVLSHGSSVETHCGTSRSIHGSGPTEDTPSIRLYSATTDRHAEGDVSSSSERVSRYHSRSSSQMTTAGLVPFPLPAHGMMGYNGPRVAHPALPSASTSGCKDPAAAVQLDFTGNDIYAGGNVGSHNTIDNRAGQFNTQINLNGSSYTSHQILLQQITEKLGAYVAPEAQLTRDVNHDPSLCYKGTRERLLREIMAWTTKETSQDSDIRDRCICIIGAPGSGKTTIANTVIVQLLEELEARADAHYPRRIVSAHYCIRRSMGATTHADKVFTTLVSQLTLKSSHIAHRVSGFLGDGLRAAFMSENQLEQLLLEAIQAHNGITLLIIDALDEISNQACLAVMLSHLIPRLPSTARLLITTRNETDVLVNLGQDLVSQIKLEIPTQESVEEVHHYIHDRVRDGVRQIFGDNPDWVQWPTAHQVDILSERADGLFIWARTAVDWLLSRVKRSGKVRRDQWIEEVKTVGTADVRSLYMLVLREVLTLGKDTEEDDRSRLHAMKEIIGFLVIVEHPITLREIEGFLDLEDFDVFHFVELARSILVPGTELITGLTVPTMHKTFVDFITSPYAVLFRIEVQDYHRSATTRSFKLMHSNLRFNILGLRSSLLSNSEVDDLEERVACIPSGLVYACMEWGYHFESTSDDFLPSRFLLAGLLYEKLLQWLEIVSVARVSEAMRKAPLRIPPSNRASRALSLLGARLGERSLDPPDQWNSEARSFVADASTLIQRFADCICQSIPHIYVSLLAFSPKESPVGRHYRSKVAAMVIPPPTEMPQTWDSWSHWESAHQHRHDALVFGYVLPILFSPCGRRIIVGHNDGSISVSDLQTGKVVLGPLRGHRTLITALCCSSNGLLLASASLDTTTQHNPIAKGCTDHESCIRIWNARSGECFSAGPIGGYGHLVYQADSMLFSPDSAYLACGSYQDLAVLVLDVHTGNCVFCSIPEGHINRDDLKGIRTPDTSHAAFGFSDSDMIQLWSKRHLNAIKLECEEEEAVTHPDYNHFSPDSQHFFALLHSQGTEEVRIWTRNTRTDAYVPGLILVGFELSDCKGRAFSSDNHWIAAVIDDQWLYIWDVQTCAPVAIPVKVYNTCGVPISSLAFSPNGKYLAARSQEQGHRSIRVFDVQVLFESAHQIRSDEDSTQGPIGNSRGWELGTKDELVFYVPQPFDEAISWQPSTYQILDVPAVIQPDLNGLVTGEEWLNCFPASST